MNHYKFHSCNNRDTHTIHRQIDLKNYDTKMVELCYLESLLKTAGKTGKTHTHTQSTGTNIQSKHKQNQKEKKIFFDVTQTRHECLQSEQEV